MTRWKCPDCSGWVREDVLVHHCWNWLQKRRNAFNARRRTLRAEMAARGDEEFCVECGAGENLTIDHIIPLSHGGLNDVSNLQYLCRFHNCSKGASV
jgi:5-methylcytosine-specific restriction endonuclease McrA